MKKFLFLLLPAIAFISNAETLPPPLKNPDFSSGFTHWIPAKDVDKARNNGFTLEKENGINILCIRGGASEVAQLTQMIAIPPAKLFRKRVTLRVAIKPEKIDSGSLQLLIREIDGAGKTIRYRTIKTDKWSPRKWDNHLISFVVTGKTKRLQLYIRSNYLLPSDLIRLKALQLDVAEFKKR